MKRTLFCFIFSFSFLITTGQTWVGVGSGLSPGGYVRCLYVYDSVLYVGGSFSTPGNNIAQWNGKTWDSLSSGLVGEAHSIVSFKDNIYIGGYFSRAGGHSASCITEWNGKALVNPGFTIDTGSISVMCQYDSLLFIGGQFDCISKSIEYQSLMTWDGTKVDSVLTSKGWVNSTVMTVYNNYLNLGFGPVSWAQPIMTWNNKKVSPLGYPASDDFYPALFASTEQNSLCVANGNLYLGGSFATCCTPRISLTNIACWNGSKWTNLGSGIKGTVYALTYYDSLLIAGGKFDTVGGIITSNIAAWNGAEWIAMGSGLDGPVYALTVFNDTLYAGGYFTTGNGIAKYTKVPTPPPAPPLDATLYPNPNQGIFTLQLSSINTQLQVDIYNVLGQKLFSQNFTTQTAQINLSGEMPGMYFYRITSADGSFKTTGKFAIQ